MRIGSLSRLYTYIFQCATKIFFMRLIIIITLISINMKVVWQIVLFTGIISPGCVGANHYCGEECGVQILQIGIFPQHYTQQIAAFILHTLEHILTSILSSKQNKLFNLVWHISFVHPVHTICICLDKE